jgi:hypothetical protein
MAAPTATPLVSESTLLSFRQRTSRRPTPCSLIGPACARRRSSRSASGGHRAGGVVDLTATIGYYAMIACALNAFAAEPTPGEPPLPV